MMLQLGQIAFDQLPRLLNITPMSQPARPVVFIGSSSEGLPAAQALQLNLDHCAEVILWSQGLFGLSEGSLESLVNRIQDFDFAILILTPDDLTLSRGNETQSPRDNVVFELGLCMGALGRTRSFIVYDRSADIKLPSDLAGVTAATYQPPSAGSIQSALGACSTAIQSAIQAQGVRIRASPEPPIDHAVQFRVLADLLDVNALQFIILMHEAGATLRREGPYMIGVRYQYSIESEEHQGGGDGYFDVDKFCSRLADAGLLTIDLRSRVGLTDRGHAFAEWLTASDYRAAYFWSDVGTWGECPSDMREWRNQSNPPRNIFELHARASAQEKRYADKSRAGDDQSTSSDTIKKKAIFLLPTGVEISLEKFNLTLGELIAIAHKALDDSRITPEGFGATKKFFLVNTSSGSLLDSHLDLKRPLSTLFIQDGNVIELRLCQPDPQTDGRVLNPMRGVTKFVQ
jgi:predicted nucleotide-binding protein